MIERKPGQLWRIAENQDDESGAMYLLKSPGLLRPDQDTAQQAPLRQCRPSWHIILITGYHPYREDEWPISMMKYDQLVIDVEKQ